jgi:hypothetical protein
MNRSLLHYGYAMKKMNLHVSVNYLMKSCFDLPKNDCCYCFCFGLLMTCLTRKMTGCGWYYCSTGWY